MTDGQYLALGFGVFVAACTVHLAAYQRLLAPALRTDDGLLKRRALARWGAFLIAFQLAVVVLCGIWILALSVQHPRGYAWSAPPLGLVAGTALPLQVAVFVLMRAVRR